MKVLHEKGTGRLTTLDPHVLSVETTQALPDADGSAHVGQPSLTLCVALAAAARQASGIVARCGREPAKPEIMRTIDGEATRAAEAVLQNAPFAIRVAA